jgi:hypothetical protein
MTRLAMQRRLAAALPLVGIVAVLLGLFLTGDASAPRPPAAGRVVVPAPMVLSLPLPRGTPVKRGLPDRARDEIQICGGAWVAADATGVPDERDLEVALAVQERDVERVVLGRQQSSPDPRHRASALWHRLLRGLQPIFTDPPAGPSPDFGAAQAQLVALALESRDPDVYASAFGICNERPVAVGTAEVPRDARCDLLSAAQWAQLDSDNVLSWLAAADEARQRGDRAAEDEALWRAAHARRFRSLLRPTVDGLVRHLPTEGVHGVVVARAIAGAFGQHALLTPASPVGQSCSEAAVGESGRHALCAVLAERLVADSDNLLHRKHGIAIGRRVGWSEERLKTLADDERALGLAVAQPAEEEDPWGCGSARRTIEQARLLAALGEIGAMRQALADRRASAADGLSLTAQRAVGR